MTAATNPAPSDPITLEVVRNKLDGIANEMQSTLVRSSFSPIVKEGLDASASLFTLEGETLAQATAIPIHLATLIPVVRTMLGKYPVPSMREGDIYIMNDPYRGGTHLPDIALVMPIFAGGRPIALERRDDPPPGRGRHVPRVRFPRTRPRSFRRGSASRPSSTATRAVGQPDPRRHALPQRAGPGDVHGGPQRAGRGVLHRGPSGGGARRTLRHEPPSRRSPGSSSPAPSSSCGGPSGAFRTGTTRTSTGSTTTASTLDELVRIEVVAEIAGDRVTIDFTGTSPQLRGPFNCVPSGAYAGAYFAVLAMSRPVHPHQRGVLPAHRARAAGGDSRESARARARSIRGPPPSSASRGRSSARSAKPGPRTHRRTPGGRFTCSRSAAPARTGHATWSASSSPPGAARATARTGWTSSRRTARTA